jgi:fructokinase
MRDDLLYLAVETGGTKLLARLVRGDTLVAEDRWPTSTPDAALAALIAFAAGRKVAGIGIAAFGPVVVDPAAPDYGEVLATPKPGWAGANLRASLSDRFAAPAALDTDVNLAAIAEQHHGAGRGCASVAYVTVGTGIGAGLARDGHTLSGALHPEVGHVPVLRYQGDESLSGCPFHPSCAEGMAAGPGVQARLRGGKLEDSPPDFAAVADYIGQLFATIVLVWSPHRIVAGGGVLGVREAATERMTAALGGYGVGPAASAPGFVAAPMLEHAGLEGALLLARRVGERTPR